MRLVTGLLLLLAVAAAAAPSTSLPPQRSSSQDDDAIFDRVRQRLYNDPDVKAHNLTITVKEGAVTLDGWVTSEKIRSKAEKITRKVPGVKKVINNLRVGEEKPS